MDSTASDTNGGDPLTNGETMAIDDIPQDPISIPELTVQYRCVTCYQMFQTVKSYRRHYRLDHLRETIGDDEDEEEASSKSSNEQSNDSSTAARANEDGGSANLSSDPQANSSSGSDIPAVVEADSSSSRSPLCKRCRTRTVNSDEEDEVDEEKEKQSATAKTGETPLDLTTPPTGIDLTTNQSNANTSDIDTRPTQTNPIFDSTGPMFKRPFVPPIRMMTAAETPIRPTTSALLRHHAPMVRMIAPPNRQKDTHQRRVEALNSLLKDANLLSKFSKVIIINFFHGRRVNPNPALGPIQSIRLGDKTETITGVDGNPRQVYREWFVRLNFDTGDWEKIQKTKPLDQKSNSAAK